MASELKECSVLPEKMGCFSLYSAANAMVRAYRPVLDELDLTYPQYLAMMVLWANDAVNVKTLGEQLHMDSGTTTPLLKRMEAKGLVTRERCKQDERSCIVCLTPKGRALECLSRKVQDSMTCNSPLSDDEKQTLKQLCDKLFLGLRS